MATYDVVAFRGATRAGAALLDQSLFGPTSGGEACTGAAKLAQWVLAELQTEPGSVPYDPDAGAGLLGRFRNRRLRTETDAFQAAGFAVGNLKARARRLETDAMPADERLADLAVDRVVLAPGAVTVVLSMTTQAGTLASLPLPIAIAP